MIWPTMLSLSSNLDDDCPSIVTSISCYVGYPEPNNWGNLAIDLLTLPGYGASVGVISSARTPYGSLNWPTDLGGSDSIIYEFNNNLINRSQTVGEAFYRSKFFCNLHYAWTSTEEYLDLYTFNLFGDPSLTLEGKQGSIPRITITTPDTALYIFNHKILECDVPFIVGAIDIEVDASDEEDGIAYVQFLVDGNYKETSPMHRISGDGPNEPLEKKFLLSVCTILLDHSQAKKSLLKSFFNNKRYGKKVGLLPTPPKNIMFFVRIKE